MTRIRPYLTALLLSAAIIAWLPVTACGQLLHDGDSTASDSTDIAADEEDLEMRLRGVTDYGGMEPIEIPSFIRPVDIKLNGTVWPFWMDPRRTYSIVHIGDSHMQADVASDVTRQLFQYEFGDAGRGLIEPLRLAGTNQPTNYVFRSDIKWKAEKYMKPSSPDALGFTGCTLSAIAPTGTITVGTNDEFDWKPFDSVKLYIDGDVDVTRVTDSESFPLKYSVTTDPADGQMLLKFDRQVTQAVIGIRSRGRVNLHGAFLSSDRPGMFYNVIGHNGASYYSYGGINGFAKGVSTLRPDVLVVQLGTNEAFGGRFNSDVFKDQIHRLVSDLRTEMPGVPVLLVTPQECQKRVGRRRKGRRSTGGTYSVNKNVALARQAILDYGREQGVAVYDFYEAAGGEGSSQKWLDAGLLSADRVHLTGGGYRLMGRLLYDALAPMVGGNPSDYDIPEPADNPMKP